MHDETSGPLAFALPGARPQYGPDKIVAVEHIDLHLTPHLADEILDGVCTLTVRAFDEPVSLLTLDAVDLEVASVDGARFTSRESALDVAFEPAILPGERATFSVHYRVAKPRHGLFFIQPSLAEPQRPVHAWTQSQDEYARFWFPCLDYPHEKQTTSTTIVVPKGTFALANGELVERHDDGDTTTFKYRQDVPHSTYLMTMVAGPFVEVAQGVTGRNETPVFYYVLPGCEDDGERAFGKTPEMIARFEERIGTPYPYARYSQIAVSDFIFGGMENTAATTQTDRTLHDAAAHADFSSDPLVSHELAHQWFGDFLTCRDWSHAWLNEGFATFMEAVWREIDLGADEYIYDIFDCLTAYLKEDADRYSRPIVCNTFFEPIEIFDRHLYQKGASVLHMLRGELGDSRFWRSVARYVRDNAGRSVETIDFIRAIERETGRNMRGFFDQWVFRAGHPQIEVSVDWDSKHKIATLTIEQKQPIDADRPPYHFDVEFGFDERLMRARVERANETIVVPLDAEPRLVQFDPGAFLLADVSYRLGTDRAATALRGDSSVIGRIRAGRELARDGGREARAAIEAAFANERFWGVLSELAAAIGATRAPWARAVLIGALAHPHPKVARAAAAALGHFRDAEAAEALVPPAREHASYFVRAAALGSLGKTRDARAFDVLAAALKERTWNSTVEAGAVHGLAELADARALPAILDACDRRNPQGLRRAAMAAVARLATLVEETRTPAVDVVAQRIEDDDFLVATSAVAAAELIADQRLLSTLDRVAGLAVDGRLRRSAAEAAIRIRKGSKVPTQVKLLRDDIDELREQQRRLQEKIEALARA